MKRILLTIVFMVVLLLVACGTPPAKTIKTTNTTTEQTSSAEPQIPAHFTTYTDEARFFSISYPTEWETFSELLESVTMKDFFVYYKQGATLEGLLFVFDATAPRLSDGSTANVNIVVQSLSEMISKGWLTLDEIVEGKLQRTEEISEEYYEISRVSEIISGREAIIVVWEEFFPDLDKSSCCVQMFMIADNILWKITCYVDSEKYDYFKDDLNTIVRSLRILK